LKLTLEHSILAPIVSDLASVARGPSPAARAIRITIKDGALTFSASDGECWLERKILWDAPAASIAVDAPVFHSIIAGGFGRVSLEAADRLTIRYGAGKFRLPLVSPDDTAFKPALKSEDFLISADSLKAGLKVTLPAVADLKEVKLYKRGVHLIAKKGKLRFTGGDGNRIVIAEVDAPSDVSEALQGKGVVLPPGACKSILRLVEDGMVGVRVSENLIELEYADVDSDVTFTSKLIDDEYPVKLVETFTKLALPNVLELPAADVLAAVNRLMPLADTFAMHGGRAMHVRALGGELKLSVVSDAGAAAEALEVETPKALSLGLNAISLKMALSSGAGAARFEFHDDFASQPCRLTFSERPGVTWILCAVRVNEPMMAEAA
jgi:DNA polymerase III sliding clamp (beta) subunit (PCNA family)